jgi:hypothetical protein
VRDFNDGLDSALGARFGALTGSVAAMVPVPGVEEIVARGRRRRRNTHAAVAGLAVLGVLGVGYAILGPLKPDGAPRPPVGPTVSASYEPPAGAERAPLGGALPDGFLPLTVLSAQPRLEPLCAGQPVPFPSNGMIAASQSGVDGVNRASLLLYPSGSDAGRAFNQYRAEATRCVAATNGTPAMMTATDLKIGATSVQVTTVDTKGKTTQVEVAVRYGRTLLLVRGPTAAAFTRAGELERLLCVFGNDCAPRYGGPPAVSFSVAGGDAWAVIVAMSSDRDAAALGTAVASASRIGYRTSVTSVDCDEGARQALGLATDARRWYVSVYFASRADADAFVAAALVPTITVIPVRTYCVS